MKWSNEQSRAINKRNSNILISAAAGSGKTTVLVERIRRLVIGDDDNPPVPIDKILVLTFTNAAASEMRQKIIDAISDELDRAESEYLRSQLRLVYTANISTFHKFEESIIKRYYFITGIDPVISICDEIQREFLVNESIDIIFEEYFNGEKVDEEFIDFLKRYATVKSEDDVRMLITRTYSFIQALPNPFEWLAEKTEALSVSPDDFVKTEAFSSILKEILLDLEEAYEKTILLYEQICDVIPRTSEKIFTDAKNLAHIIEEAKGYTDAREMYGYLSTAINGFTFVKLTIPKEEKEDHAPYKSIINARRKRVKDRISFMQNEMFAKTLDEYVEEINETYASAKKLEEIILKFHTIFSDLKRRDGVIDFSDIEHFALHILEDERVRDEYREKFEHIFVDEYQDTNYIQEELISRIKSERNMFMVGDVKQSIYKFRLAEPEIFIGKYKIFSDSEADINHRIDLNNNYRSKHKIIDDVNSIFSRLMKERLSGIAYDDNSALHKGLDYETIGYDGSCDSPIDYYLIDKSANAKPTPENEEQEELQDEIIIDLKDAELEANVAANIIKEVISGRSGGKYFDAKNGIYKDYEYRDIVILLKEVKTSGQIWYDVLQAKGIPAFVSSGDGYFNTVEVETFLNLLRLLDNTCQDVPLVGTMYSPIFDFSIEELITIRLAFPKEAFYKAFFSYIEIGDDDLLKEKCNTMIASLEEWRRKEMFMDLSEFLWDLLKESGYYDYSGALPAGEQRRANLLALLDKARSFQTRNSRGLFGFVGFIEKMKENKISMEEVKLFSEGDNAVRIMSIHNSKGLEFPMVIVPQNAKGINAKSDSNKVTLHREIGIALQWENPATRSYKSTLFQKMIKYKKTFEDRAEALRVLYVALTRAMDRLVIIGTINKASELLAAAEDLDPALDVDVMSSKSFMEMLVPILSETNAEVSLIYASDIQESLSEESVGDNVATRLIERLDNSEEGIMYQEIDRRLSFTYPGLSSLTVKSKYSVSEINKTMMAEKNLFIAGSQEESLDEIGAVPLPLDNADVRDKSTKNAAMRGTALHSAFERIDYSAAYANKEKIEFFEEYLNSLVANDIISAEMADKFTLEQIMTYANSEIFARAACSSAINRETPFIYKYEYLGEEVIVQGIIDLWFIENGSVVLIDFKSGYFDKNKPGEEDRMINTYKGQISIYREALGSIISMPVNETYLYLTKPGITIKVAR